MFGISIPCLADRVKSPESQAEQVLDDLNRIVSKTVGANGLYLQRCFKDLLSAMKDVDDTGFYCYRAIESLRHHCAAIHGLTAADKPHQWEKFREVSGAKKETLLAIKTAADPLRHGDMGASITLDRAELLKTTWDVVDGYLDVV